MNCPICQKNLPVIATYALNTNKYECFCLPIYGSHSFQCFVKEEQIIFFEIRKPPFFFRYKVYLEIHQIFCEWMLYCQIEGKWKVMQRECQTISIPNAYQLLQRYYQLKAFS